MVGTEILPGIIGIDDCTGIPKTDDTGVTAGALGTCWALETPEAAPIAPGNCIAAAGGCAGTEAGGCIMGAAEATGIAVAGAAMAAVGAPSMGGAV